MNESEDRASMLLEPMKAVGVPLPDDLVIWNSTPDDSDRIKMVNQEDFPKKFILQSLGIDESPLAESFGICDKDEIEGRLATMNWLVSHSKKRGEICGLGINPSIPDGTADFLDFFSDRVPYWDGIRDLDNILMGDLPPRLRRLKEFIRDSSPLEAAEIKFKEAVIERIEKISVFSGFRKYVIISTPYAVRSDGTPYLTSEVMGHKVPKTADISWTHTLTPPDDGKCFGYRQFTRGLSPSILPQIPDWAKKHGSRENIPKLNPLHWLGIAALKRWLVKIQREDAVYAANQSRKIEKMPQSTSTDIAEFLRLRLNEELPKTDLSNHVIRVFFDYSERSKISNHGGLEVFVYGFSPEGRINNHDGLDLLDISPRQFSGFSEKEKGEMDDEFDRLRWKAYEYREAVKMARELARPDGRIPGFVGERIQIESPNTDMECRWFAASNICMSAALRPIFDEMQKHRKFLGNHIYHLKAMADLANKLVHTAKSLGTSVCTAKIAEEGSVTSFGTVFPIQLLADLKAKDIVPVSGLPDVNCRPVGFTGFHGGGKTETMLAVVASMWLFQSGIPPLGKGTWRQNVKRLLGFVFIDNARKHSTCQRLIAKMVDLFKAMEGVQPQDVVAVLDELGTGTQEDDGTKLGKDVLAECTARGISVIFTTQIQDLARYARDELGAACFQFDEKHKLSSGIGRGGMKRLRKKQGLDMYLTHSTKKEDAGDE